MIDDNEINRIIDVWKATIDVQKHFNDLCLKIRQLAIASLGLFLGSYGYLIKNSEDIESILLKPESIAISIFSSFIWTAFFINDFWGFHKFLVGSVKHGVSIEEKYKELLPEICLSEKIKQESATSKFLFLKMDSKNRIWLFYTIGYFITFAPIYLGGFIYILNLLNCK